MAVVPPLPVETLFQTVPPSVETCHWNVDAPVAVTLNVMFALLQIVRSTGWAVMTGAAVIVTLRLALTEQLPSVTVTDTVVAFAPAVGPAV
jgi:hypothetical protein